MAVGGGGGQMTDAQIKKMFNQFKVDMKPMINDIAERISETKTTTLKRQVDLYEQENERDKKFSIAKIEGEMLTISNHLKNKIERLNTDFEAQIRNA